MTARCAAHKTARDCCAVDYMCHTTDGTSWERFFLVDLLIFLSFYFSAALSNNKTFPSRSGPHESKTKYFEVFVRRLFRIFSHVSLPWNVSHCEFSLFGAGVFSSSGWFFSIWRCNTALPAVYAVLFNVQSDNHETYSYSKREVSIAATLSVGRGSPVCAGRLKEHT